MTFKEAINDAIRAGCAPRRRGARFATETAAMGTPTVNLDHALRIAGELEDEELVRKARVGK